ncbi:MAG TPA: hypothetical protein VKK79_21615 [Candidatus Lokiarchaeia archaeon]|nr:hypothetical protein [Candidatus Lokiarchaeia archaeon]
MLWEIPLAQVDREICIASTMLLIFAQFWFAARFFQAFNKSDRENPVFGGVGVLYLLLGLGRIFYMLSDFYLGGTNTPEGYVAGKLGGVLQGVGIGIFILLHERTQFNGKDKYLLFIGYNVFIVLYAVIPDKTTATWIISAAQFFNIFIFFGFIDVIWKSKGDIRVRSILILIGFAALVIGTLLTSAFLIAQMESYGLSFYSIHTIANVFQLVGTCVIFKGYI